jgi:hypothetical protein
MMRQLAKHAHAKFQLFLDTSTLIFDHLKKEKVSGFDQLLIRANLTADRIWLAILLCCAI